MSDFKAKMHPNRFWLGLRPRPRSGSLQRSSRPPSWIKGGLLLREGEGIWQGMGRGGKGGEDRGGEGRGGREGEGVKERGRDGKGGHPQYFIAPSVPVF